MVVLLLRTSAEWLHVLSNTSFNACVSSRRTEQQTRIAAAKRPEHIFSKLMRFISLALLALVAAVAISTAQNIDENIEGEDIFVEPPLPPPLSTASAVLSTGLSLLSE
eukprot:m.127299 g.127299  ORF g.127299 m.127299 type:complete len:108 (-) comp14702_c0_seq4:42-365(-)